MYKICLVADPENEMLMKGNRERGREREREIQNRSSFMKLSVDNTIDMLYEDSQISKQLSDDN